MRVSTVHATMTCPRCQAPVQGDYKYCPECACRLRLDAPEAERIGGGRGLLLVGLFGVVLLGAGIFVGMNVVGEQRRVIRITPPPTPRYERVADIGDHLADIAPGVAYYSTETVSVAPPVSAALTDLAGTMDRATQARLLKGLEADDGLYARWPRALTLFYDATADMLDEKTRARPIYTKAFKCMRYEVTRGQYQQFLQAVQKDAHLLSRTDWVKWIWRGEMEGGDAYAHDRARYWAMRYRQDWWTAVLDRYRTRDIARRRKAAHDALVKRLGEHRASDAERSEADIEAEIFEALPPAAPPRRPAFLGPEDLRDVTSAQLARVTDAEAVLLLVPPAWIRVRPNGQVTWQTDPKRRDLPVTGISWWDANMFTLWARQATGNPMLRIPNWREWQRVATSGEPERPADDFGTTHEEGRRWPWGGGDVVDQHGCNNLNYENQAVPRLRPVQTPYGWHRGQTRDGVLNMAGNAMEWTMNDVPDKFNLQDGIYYVVQSAEVEGGADYAYACGGSFLSGIYDCQTTSVKSLPKTARQIDVGFRLVSDPLQ